MRKSILIITIIFFNNLIFAQSFPEDNPELLLNRVVKPKVISETLQQYAYKNFFLEFDIENKQFTADVKKNKPFPSGPTYSLVSDYSKLVGKEFKVVEIYEMKPKYSYSKKEYALKLENAEIGVIYYNYDPRFEHTFELEVVGGLIYPEVFFCSKITNEKDKFENKETFYTPAEKGVSFVKVVENGVTIIYLSIHVYGNTLNVGEKGLYILFDDGSKYVNAEVKIDVKTSNGSGYDYSAFIRLTPDDLKNFSTKNMTDKRAYIYDGVIDKEASTKIKEYLKCLMK